MPRPREFDEQEVLLAARAAFWQRGYAGTSVADLTAATGLGKGSLYGAFGDKRGLFVRVFDHFLQETSGDLDAMLEGPDDTACTRLQAYVEYIATTSAATDGGDPRGCMLAKTTAELACEDPEVRERAGQAFDAHRARLRAAIVGAQRHGGLDPTADAGVHAALLLSTLRGMESLGKAGMPLRELQAIGQAALDALPRPRSERAPVA